MQQYLIVFFALFLGVLTGCDLTETLSTRTLSSASGKDQEVKSDIYFVAPSSKDEQADRQYEIRIGFKNLNPNFSWNLYASARDELTDGKILIGTYKAEKKDLVINWDTSLLENRRYYLFITYLDDEKEIKIQAPGNLSIMHASAMQKFFVFDAPINNQQLADKSFDIKFMAMHFADGDSIELYVSQLANDTGTASGTIIANKISPKSTSYVWDTTNVPNGVYYVRAMFTKLDKTTQYVFSPGSIEVLHPHAPVLSLKSHNGQEVLLVNPLSVSHAEQISIEATDADGDNLTFTLEMRKTKNGAFTPVDTQVSSTGPTSYNLRWDITDTNIYPRGEYEYQIRVTASDNNGGISKVTSKRSFAIANSIPNYGTEGSGEILDKFINNCSGGFCHSAAPYSGNFNFRDKASIRARADKALANEHNIADRVLGYNTDQMPPNGVVLDPNVLRDIVLFVWGDAPGTN